MAHGNRQKYESRNPAQRALIGNFLRQVEHCVRQVAPRTLLDIGCGEGYVLEHLQRSGVDAEIHGIDLRQEAIDAAQRRVGPPATFEVRDARMLADFGRRFELVMMLEVLEHVERPETLLSVLDGLTTGHVLLSVPREPFFRGLNLLRGKNVANLGNDPEHINLWGRRAFLEFVASRFDVICAPGTFPWTLVLARSRRR